MAPAEPGTVPRREVTRGLPAVDERETDVVQFTSASAPEDGEHECPEEGH